MSKTTSPQVTTENSPDPESITRFNEMVKTAESTLVALREIAETAKSSMATVSESQTLITTILNEAQARQLEIQSVATLALTAKTQISDAQTVIATKSDHIQQAQDHADSVRANLDRIITETTQQATEVEGLKSRTQSATDSATNLLTEIRTTKGSVETDATSTTESRKSAEDSAEQAKSLAEKSTSIETRINQYETRLDAINSQCEVQLEKIESLLRGATSAGLAHAFDDRRQTFLKPHVQWQRIFIGSLIVLVGLAAHGLWSVYQGDAPPEWNELVRMWLSRIPLVGALVWLAMHASREAALAKRLEEDYGYKAAVATCFEGFRKEMTAIGNDVGFDSALGKLCSDTLTTMATPPGRIYDKHSLAVTPIDEMKEVTKAATEATRSLVDASKPMVEAAAKAARIGL